MVFQMLGLREHLAANVAVQSRRMTAAVQRARDQVLVQTVVISAIRLTEFASTGPDIFLQVDTEITFIVRLKVMAQDISVIIGYVIS